MIESCYNELSGVTPINIYNTLKEHDSEYIYYRTDHHWTSSVHIMHISLPEQNLDILLMN